LNCGSAFSRASHRRQSYSVVQYRASACVAASCTPWDRSATSSRVGQRVAAPNQTRPQPLCGRAQARYLTAMADKPEEQARKQRLARQLRENLKRRKAQARSRAAPRIADANESAEAGPGTGPTAPDFRRNRGRE